MSAMPRLYVRGTPEVRFWARVQKTDGCWLWVGGTVGKGYGAFHPTSKENGYAHRFSYELHNGPIPDGMQVCHTCDNPPCVNPAHLFLGTNTDNVRDCMAKGRFRAWNTGKTHCIHGHEFTPENTKHTRRGKRRCVTCDRARDVEYRRRVA